MAQGARSVDNSGTVLDMAWMVNLRDEEWVSGPRADTWWTGLPPQSAPGMTSDGIGSLPYINLATASREDWQTYFDNTWTITEVLFAGLHTEEPFYRPPVHGLRHPLIFYYGHPACLYVNKLRVAGAIDQPVNQYLESILETGVDEMSWDDMHKNDMVWPTVQEVKDYRAEVYQLICNLIATHPDLEPGHAPIDQNSELWSLVMGFEHERIHIETSSVLIREMPLHLVQHPEHWKRPYAMQDTSLFPQNEMLQVAAGDITLGKALDHPTYGFDNEYGTRTMHVPEFKASKYMVSNGEYLDFVKDGGYQYEELWTSEGWGWRVHRNAKWPFFWHPKGPSGLHQYDLRTVFEMVDLPMSWPAEVNYHEGSAFATWKGKATSNPDLRLITEAEHNRLRAEGSHEFTFDDSNTNLVHTSATPVDKYPASPTGHHDVMGNGWEWTEDHFNPLDGFKVHPVYTDFSTPCFDGRHNMIMGGSFVSTGDQSSTYARYSFRPHFLQHSGFRLTESVTPAPATYLGAPISKHAAMHEATTNSGDVYESSEMLQQYMVLHYGDSTATFRGAEHEMNPTAASAFPKRCGETLSKAYAQYGEHHDEPTKALDVGCAVGGATLELTRDFDSVMGIDMSQSFIDTARSIQKIPTSINIEAPREGVLRVGESDIVSVDSSLDLSRANFRVGDACALDAHALGGPFDAVLMANLLCRVPDPNKVLQDLSQANNGLGIVRQGGILMLVSPFSWDSQFTRQELWLGGRPGAEDSFQGLVEALGDNFELQESFPMPLVIREHRRRWQYIVPDAAIFKRIA